MKPKIEYDPDGFVTLNGIEWDWEHLKQTCYCDFVYEARPRGTICHKLKVPREILNEWIESEDWEIAKKSHWQRPYSYRIDAQVAGLLQNIYHLSEMQKEVNDIPFDASELENRITINIEVKHQEGVITHKNIVIEKYKVLISDEPDEFGDKAFEDHTEIRYKVAEFKDAIVLKYKPMIKSKKT